MTDTFAIQRVRDGLLADIARRNTLIHNHQESASALHTDNAIDARHAAVAQALIDQLNAGTGAVSGPTTEIDAAALVFQHADIGGFPTLSHFDAEGGVA